MRVEHVVGMRIAPVHAAGWSGLRLGGSVGGAFAAKTIKQAVILCIVGGSASQFDIKEKAVRAAGKKKTVRLLPPSRERAAPTFYC